MTARWARTARGWGVALLAGVLTAALHASAGGSFPAPAIALLAVLLSGLVSTALIGRNSSVPRLAATITAGQLTFHTVFTVFGDTAGIVLTADAHAGHAGSAIVAQTEATHAGSAHTSPGMLVAHIVAGTLSALLLCHGERALSGLQRLTAFALTRLSQQPAPLPLPRLRPAGIDSTAPHPRTPTRLRALRYRGPPALLRAV